MLMGIWFIPQFRDCMQPTLLSRVCIVRVTAHPSILIFFKAYTGYASGHFGDSIQYVNDSGSLQNIESSSVFGCSHNTGIGLEEADAPPFASICAEDHGAIWLNTDTRYMSGVKIANENVTNGASGEPSKLQWSNIRNINY
jgi:hypothetical protein